MIKKKQFTFSPKSSDSSDDSDYYNKREADKDLNDRDEQVQKDLSLVEELPKISDSPIQYLNIDESDRKVQ